MEEDTNLVAVATECWNCYCKEWEHVDLEESRTRQAKPYFCLTCKENTELQSNPKLRFERILDVLDETDVCRFPDVFRMLYKILQEEIEQCKRSQS